MFLPGSNALLLFLAFYFLVVQNYFTNDRKYFPPLKFRKVSYQGLEDERDALIMSEWISKSFIFFKALANPGSAVRDSINEQPKEIHRKISNERKIVPEGKVRNLIA